MTAGALVLCLSHAHVARADDYKVYSPRAVKGEFALEANTNFDLDHRTDMNKYISEVAGIEYGLTDWWQTEVSVELEKDNGDHGKATNLKWENIFVPFKPGEKIVDVGLYIEYERALQGGEPDNLEGKLLLEKAMGQFTNTANLIISHEIGQNSSSDTNTGFALKSIYRLNREFQPGIEYYADTGPLSDHESFRDQSHQAGPVIEGRFGPVKYDTGVLFGVSQAAPDATIKVNLEYEF